MKQAQSTLEELKDRLRMIEDQLSFPIRAGINPGHTDKMRQELLDRKDVVLEELRALQSQR